MDSLSLRPAALQDRVFVEAIYFETQRWIIETLFGWRGDDYEKAKFARAYDEANSSIISADGIDIGWMSVVQNQEAWELDGIYIGTTHQRRGLGTRLVVEVVDRAATAGVPLRLSTAKINPARSLYARLGFMIIAESEFKVYFEIRSP
jgi:ribosomal protein S18 acetylase RimI-like enzyme